MGDMTTAAKPSITAIVLTKDEGLHIRRCIESLIPAVQRVCIIDSGSIDDTLKIAESLGAGVFRNPWINYAAQFNWALGHCGISTDWVLRLDADEYLEPGLQLELQQSLSSIDADVHGILLKRKYFFMRSWIRHGGMYPIHHLRLWRTGSAQLESRWMDEHAVLSSGRTAKFDGAFVDDNLRDLAWWSGKHIGYATREAVQALLDQFGLDASQAVNVRSGAQASVKRWVKKKVYNRLPLGLGPFLYLLYRLFPRLGILDGRRGIAFHVLQGFWYRLLVDLRRNELKRLTSNIPTIEGRVKSLEQSTGLQIQAFREKRC